MRAGVCNTTCASMRSAVVDARVGVLIIDCASMRAAVVDAGKRVYYHLCQHARSGRRGCT